jgi:hypothetical protein
LRDAQTRSDMCGVRASSSCGCLFSPLLIFRCFYASCQPPPFCFQPDAAADTLFSANMPPFHCAISLLPPFRLCHFAISGTLVFFAAISCQILILFSAGISDASERR